MRLIDADKLKIKPEYMHDICGETMIRVEDVARIINEMPAIGIHPQWIPISEGLPVICEYDLNGQKTFSCRVLSTQIYSDGLVFVGSDRYTSSRGWLSEVLDENGVSESKVIAWMPLPEPYKQKE